MMEDYHVFSSANLTDWTDHGVILNQTNVPWLTRQALRHGRLTRFQNGKAYFIFLLAGGLAWPSRTSLTGRSRRKPAHRGARGIDPAVLWTRTAAPICFLP